MLRATVVLILIGFALVACAQYYLFGCDKSPNHCYCPSKNTAPDGPPASSKDKVKQ